MITWECPKCSATIAAIKGAISVTCSGKDPITKKLLHRPCEMKKT